MASGEAVALLGGDGAGKSTLVELLAGAVVADEGEIRIDGRPVQISSPASRRADAKLIIMDEPTAALGVAHQVPSLIERRRDRGEAVVPISHDMADVTRVADRVFITETGRLVASRRVGRPAAAGATAPECPGTVRTTRDVPRTPAPSKRRQYGDAGK